MYVGLAGGGLFIIIQLILIVDFAYGLADKVVGQYEETESRYCFAGRQTFFFVNHQWGLPTAFDS